MIIHQPEIKKYGNEVIVSSRIETITKTALPKDLWFRYPIEYYDAVSERSDAFFTTLFLLGMHLGEDIEVRGDISPKLAHNIDKSSTLYFNASKTSFNRIAYHFDSIKAANPNLDRTIKLCSFSGGVDSFYAFWSHLYPNQSDYPVKLTHGLFILGFDILLQNQEYYNHLYLNYKKHFDDWGLSLIQCSTNAYSFYQFRVRWGLPLIPTLAGAAAALGNLVSDYLQPGNYDPNPSKKVYPSSYLHLLSTESLNLQSHGIEINRGVKLEKMIGWEPIRKNLRVCLSMNNDLGIISCKKCRKCLDTILILNLFNSQHLYPSFNHKFSSIDFIRLCWEHRYIEDLYEAEYMDLYIGNNRFEFILILLLMTPINLLKKIISTWLIPRIPNRIVRAIKNLFYSKQES